MNTTGDLIAILLDIQAASGKNYIDKNRALLVSKVLGVPFSQLYDILTFYAMFNTEPKGEYVVEICQSAPCQFCEAQKVVNWFEAETGIKIGETDADGKITLQRTSCVGACDTGPAVKIGDTVFGGLDREKVKELVKHCRDGTLP